MAELKIRQFGDPVLREKAEVVAQDQINSLEIQNFIKSMRAALLKKELGVGLAAPQVGKSKALAVIALRPSKLRPKTKSYDLVVINPHISETKGNRKQFYEGCISAGGKAGLFARVPRYKEIRLKYLDEKGKKRTRKFTGLKAHVLQHEVDHLNGVLFVDRVEDTKSYLTHKEYMKLVRKKMKDES